MPHLESVPPNDTVEPKVDYYYLLIDNPLLILITKCLHILSFVDTVEMLLTLPSRAFQCLLSEIIIKIIINSFKISAGIAPARWTESLAEK